MMMDKSAVLFALFFCGSVCAEDSAQAAEQPLGFEAFRDICYKNVTSGFEGSESAADLYQIKFFTPAPMMIGVTEDKSLSAMIENNVCSITTESQNDPELGIKFSAWISYITDRDVPSSFPMRLEVNGKVLLFMHNREGGEAFVLMAL